MADTSLEYQTPQFEGRHHIKQLANVKAQEKETCATIYLTAEA